MSIVAVAGLKGGSGKSLTTITLAGELMRRGRTVMLVDGDRGRAPSRWIARGRPPIHLHTLQGPMLRPDHLAELVAREDRIAVIDTPSDDREAQWNVLMAADVAILPCVPSVLSRDAWPATFQLVFEATRLRPWLKVGFVSTGGAPNSRAAFTPYALPDAWRWPASLPRRPQHEAALLEAVPVGSFSPRSLAAREAARFADEVLARLPPRPRTRSVVVAHAVPFDVDDLEALGTSVSQSDPSTASKRRD